MIQIKNLKKEYQGFSALKGLSFTAKKGEILALLGPNGAGKTTTMKIITGFLSGTSGEVVIDGNNIIDESLSIQNTLGYLPENTPLYPELNVYEHLEFAAEVHGITNKSEKKKAIEAVVKTCSLKDKLYFNISELSKGYKQRTALAQAIIHDPSYLILDEPTTGLDPNQILEIRTLIRTLGKKKTIIFSSHIMQEVEALADRVVLIHSGEIVAEGTPEELSQKDEAKDTSLMIRLIIRGGANNVLSYIKKVPLVTKVVKEASIERGVNSYVVHASEDIRENLCSVIIKGSFGLLECSFMKHSLEDVFQKLTK
jgi:ABC-2 type transport system ATP-binding protein